MGFQGPNTGALAPPISFGFPPSPAERSHWLISTAGIHVGGSIDTWGAGEWEMVARYLANALEISVAARRDAGAALFKLQLETAKRPPGRPRTRPFRTGVGAALSALFDPTPKRKRGAPRKRNLQGIYDLIEMTRAEYLKAYPRARISDRAVIEYGLKRYASGAGKSQRWVREQLPKLQKNYSDAKRFVEQSKRNS